MKKLLCILLALSLTIVCTVVSAAAEGEVIKVACVGDSITEGTASTNKSTTSYPAQLQTFLGDGYEVKNFGASGYAALKDVGYVQSYWKHGNYTQSLEYNADIVIIMLGTNDIIDPKYSDEVYTADLTALIDSYKALESEPDIYLATAPCAYTEGDSDRAERIQTILVDVQKQIAADTGCKLVDINARTQNMAEYFADGLHPNDAGYLKLAQFMYEGVFGFTTAEVTVQTEAGNAVRLGGQEVISDENGKAAIVTGDGMKTFTVTKTGGGYVDFSVEIKGNTEIDCAGLTLPENLAANAAVTDKDGAVTAVNDANSSTGWQRSDGYANAWIILNLGEEKTIDRAIVQWSGSDRADHDAYYLEYSSDGSSWTKVSDATFVYGKDIDTVSFAPVSAQHIRMKIDSGMGKGQAHILEMGLFKSPDTAFTPVVKYENDPASSDEPADKDGGLPAGAYVAIIAAVIASGCAVAAGVAVSKKSKVKSE